MKKVLCAFAACLMVAGAAQADIIIEDTGGARLIDAQQDGSGSSAVTTTTALNVGTKNNSNGFDMHAGFVFQMTGIADGADLLTADFSVSRTGGQGQSAYNIDLYANRVSSTSTFNVSDYEVFDQLIMEDFWVVDDGLGNYSLDTTGQGNLLTYLQNNWVQDEFVFFTLKADIDTAPGFIMGEDANANTIFGSSTDNDSRLTLTAVPEPSAIGMLGLGAAALLLSRRRVA